MGPLISISGEIGGCEWVIWDGGLVLEALAWAVPSAWGLGSFSLGRMQVSGWALGAECG